MSSPQTVQEWENFYENKSLYCHPEKRFDSFGRPTSSQSYDFVEPQEYLRKLLSKKTDGWGNKTGLIEIVKEDLREAKARWRYHCEHSKMIDPKTPPTGDFAKEINRLTGKKKVLEKEARLLNKQLQIKEQYEENRLKKKQKKFANQGNCKLIDGLIGRCDFRDVEYKDGKPFFIDDGSSVDEYIAKCRELKRTKAIAMARVQRKELAQIEQDRKNKIESKKILVDEQLQKIRRRKPPESQPTA